MFFFYFLVLLYFIIFTPKCFALAVADVSAELTAIIILARWTAPETTEDSHCAAVV